MGHFCWELYSKIPEKMIHYGMKWNDNNLYTILPIQQAADAIYQRQLDRLDLAAQQQRIANLLLEKESSA